MNADVKQKLWNAVIITGLLLGLLFVVGIIIFVLEASTVTIPAFQQAPMP